MKWFSGLAPKSARGLVVALISFNLITMLALVDTRNQQQEAERRLEVCDQDKVIMVKNLKDEFLSYLLAIVSTQENKNRKLDTLVSAPPSNKR